MVVFVVLDAREMPQNELKSIVLYAFVVLPVLSTPDLIVSGQWFALFQIVHSYQRLVLYSYFHPIVLMRLMVNTVATILIPNTVIPNTVIPNTVIPNTVIPTTVIPNTVIPTTVIPNTVLPTTDIPNTGWFELRPLKPLIFLIGLF